MAAAADLFDQVWNNFLEREVRNAPQCSIDIVFERLFESAKRRVSESAEHREFRVRSCLFIAQLPSLDECDELWFISSSSPDPRTLYVNFITVAEREEFKQLAERLSLNDEVLDLELIRDFMKKFRLQ